MNSTWLVMLSLFLIQWILSLGRCFVSIQGLHESILTFFREKMISSLKHNVINAAATNLHQPYITDENRGCTSEIKILTIIAVLSPGDMAKNKQKGKKQKNVFQVANKHVKPKNKAKPVTTTLKHVRSVFIRFTCTYMHPAFPSALCVSSTDSSITCDFTDQCSEKWESGEPKSDLLRSSEGCEERFKVCCSRSKETNAGTGFKLWYIHHLNSLDLI